MVVFIKKTKFFLSKSSSLFLILFKIFRYNDRRIVNKKTNLVIEGFPRSANTFCYAAFKTIEPKLSISSHIHLPVNVNLAFKKKVPCIVLIREPLDCIISFIIREKVDIKYAMEYYLFFHKNLKINYSNLLIVQFSTIVHDFSIVIKKFNSIFKENYKIENKEIFTEKVFDYVKEMDMKDTGEKKINHNTVAIPSKERKKQKDKYINLIKTNPNYSLLLNQCSDIYIKIKNQSKNII